MRRIARIVVRGRRRHADLAEWTVKRIVNSLEVEPPKYSRVASVVEKLQRLKKPTKDPGEMTTTLNRIKRLRLCDLLREQTELKQLFDQLHSIASLLLQSKNQQQLMHVCNIATHLLHAVLAPTPESNAYVVPIFGASQREVMPHRWSHIMRWWATCVLLPYYTLEPRRNLLLHYTEKLNRTLDSIKTLPGTPTARDDYVEALDFCMREDDDTLCIAARRAKFCLTLLSADDAALVSWCSQQVKDLSDSDLHAFLVCAWPARPETEDLVKSLWEEARQRGVSWASDLEDAVGFEVATDDEFRRATRRE
ncbi:MAG: hypothetical protein MHM6MM_001258 [Cercozoa sp. M6MM]